MIISCSLPLLHCVQVVTYIERIILNGMAYVSQGSVYFDTNRFRYVHMCVLCCVWARVRVCVCCYTVPCVRRHIKHGCLTWRRNRMLSFCVWVWATVYTVACVWEEQYAHFLCVSLSKSVHSCLCAGGAAFSLYVCESEQKCTQLPVCGRNCMLTFCVWVWAKVYTVACVREGLPSHSMCMCVYSACACSYSLCMFLYSLCVCVCVCVQS